MKRVLKCSVFMLVMMAFGINVFARPADYSYSGFGGGLPSSVVQLDEELLNEDNYTKKSGSVIIELNPEYVATLAPGVHTIEIFFDDSYSVKTTFVVNAPATLPSTGETVNYRMIATVGILFVISTSCAIGAFITKKKEEIK